MRISIIEPIGNHGGMNYYDKGLADGLVEAGIDVILYTSDLAEFNESNSFKLVQSFKNVFSIKNKISKGLLYFKSLMTSLINSKMYNSKIIHFHFFHFTLIEFASVFFAIIFNNKIVVTIHDVQSFSGGDNSLLRKFIIKYSDALIVHNNYCASILISDDSRLINKIHVIPHGNYLNFIKTIDSKSEVKKKFDIPEDKKIILFFGQIKLVKGLDVLLNAISDLSKIRDDFVLLIAGKVWKDNFDKYQKIIDDNEISNFVFKKIGYVNDSDVPSYYGVSDLVVLPYREIYQSGVLLMSMSYRVPVIVSSLPGMKEVVTDLVNGIVFESEDHVDLKNKINLFLDLPVTSKDLMIKSAFELMMKKHDWNYIGRLTADVYKSI